MYSTLGRTARRAALGLLPLLWTTVAHAQEYQGPLWGGGGGTSSYNLDCGSAGVMVGVFGKTGSWIDQIGLTCQKVNTDGTLGSEYTRAPVGGPGGTGTAKRCAAGQVVSSMGSKTGSFVDVLILLCSPWSSSTRRPDPNVFITRRFGESGAVGYLGGIKDNATVSCPADKVGKAIRGKRGNYIDSLQFVCDEYNK